MSKQSEAGAQRVECGHDFDGLVRSLGNAHDLAERQAAEIARLEARLRAVEAERDAETLRANTYLDKVKGLRAVIEDIALVTAYDEKLPGSLAGHVKVLVDELMAEARRLREALETLLAWPSHKNMTPAWDKAREALTPLRPEPPSA